MQQQLQQQQQLLKQLQRQQQQQQQQAQQQAQQQTWNGNNMQTQKQLQMQIQQQQQHIQQIKNNNKNININNLNDENMENENQNKNEKSNNFPKKVSVLDVACGKGEDLHKYCSNKRFIHAYVGVDIASVCVTYARETYFDFRKKYYHKRNKQKTVAPFFRGFFIVADISNPTMVTKIKNRLRYSYKLNHLFSFFFGFFFFFESIFFFLEVKIKNVF